MAEITQSRMAMYEGIIALAWADHQLDEEETKGLHELIDNNPRFTNEQREVLRQEINTPLALKDIWPRITDKYDRAYLLDIANFIFMKDGKFCENERELYDTFLKKHLESIDSEQTLQEIRQMAGELRQKRKLDEERFKAEAKEAFSSELGFFYRIRKIFDFSD